MMTLDTTEFDRAMIQYAAASKKDFKDIANKRVYDIALRSIKHMKSARRGAITKLARQKKLIWYWANKVYVPRGLRKQDAYRAAEDDLRRKARAVGFMKGFFLYMAKLVSPYLDKPAKPRGRKGGSFRGFIPMVSPATAQRPTSSFGVKYDYEHKTQSARDVENKLNTALQAGLASSARDMMVYVDRKMGKTAKRFSARGAR